MAIVLAAVISLAMFALYTQRIACDNLSSDCHINVVIHPEDRLFGPAVRT
ncbi:MAG TPA: hypothetical protein VKE27_04750 [Candidatus Dormibacteraeota bacterium]|nr:hypothetical protein [Candidatus Dormibacteraeota bacterium]